ncbi:SpaA isopeptide-forming pilin-related protein [Dubosiella newyorkensis]|uniref:SpaA isopeptide-forming pilin-related protein n=1 Tax=Dubosiella newyorkensis TaxID=1862672 RepID=UPI0023F4648A|nr:SpaA isopeptide-forming pilin-related protein [Dubosiella newyorkensis]
MNKSIFKLFGMSALVLSAILRGLSIADRPLVLEAHALSREQEKGVHLLGDGPASILIKGNAEQSLLNKSFRVYQLFHAENSQNQDSINYSWNLDTKAAIQKLVGQALNKAADQVHEYEAIDYIQSLNNEGHYADFRYFMETLRTELNATSKSVRNVTIESVDENNQARLEGLPFGYYLLDETSSSGTHSANSLCMVSTANPTSEIHIKSDYPELIKKIFEDDQNVGWNDIGDHEIGQSIPYKFESRIPDLNGYTTYTVQFQDRMDEALDFDPSSIEVKIGDYTLQKGEWVLEQNVDGDSFRITIPDLKAIVDREFASGLDGENGHNEYGQKLQLFYRASLNAKAIDRGLEGIENHVRLVYTNDPDSNNAQGWGSTPWDSVVSYTYHIQGKKVNEKDRPLEGASFLLFEDAACTRQVYVEKDGERFIVSQEANDQSIQSGANGDFLIGGLDQGTYYLKEIKAPEGYRQLLDPIEIEIKPTFVADRNKYTAQGEGLLDLSAGAKIKTFYSGLLNEEAQDLLVDVSQTKIGLSIVNKAGILLPYTGSYLTLGMIVFGCGLSLLAYKTIKKHEKE